MTREQKRRAMIPSFVAEHRLWPSSHEESSFLYGGDLLATIQKRREDYARLEKQSPTGMGCLTASERSFMEVLTKWEKELR